MIGKKIMIGLVRLYQASLGLYVGGNCRFHPTCSEYAIGAIHEHGAWRGTWLAMKRLIRCRPLGAHGVDFVPMRVKEI